MVTYNKIIKAEQKADTTRKLLMCGLDYLTIGDRRSAVQCKEKIKIQASSFYELRDLIFILLKLGNKNELLACLTKTKATASSFCDWEYLANNYLDIGEKDLSLQTLKSAEKHARHKTSYWIELAYSYFVLDEVAQARRSINQAISYAEETVNGYFWIFIYFSDRIHDWHQAHATLHQAHRYAHTCHDHLMLGLMASRIEHYERAKTYLLAAQKLPIKNEDHTLIEQLEQEIENHNTH